MLMRVVDAALPSGGLDRDSSAVFAYSSHTAGTTMLVTPSKVCERLATLGIDPMAMGARLYRFGMADPRPADRQATARPKAANDSS